MENKLNIRALKGAPLSILIVLITQRRSVSHAFLCAETGYSDKSVTQGLNYLVSNQIVTRIGHSGFQLTDGNYQLPLYWNEQVEPANPSPALNGTGEPTLFDLPEKISRKNSDIEISETGKNPTLEERVSALESEILRLKDQINRKNSENIGEIPDDIKSSSINPDTDKGKTDDEYSRNFYDLYESSLDQYKGCQLLELSREQLEKLARIHADLDRWEFVITRAPSYEVAEKWLKFDKKAAKFELCNQLGIKQQMQRDITNADDVNLFEIDWHYWHWRMSESDNKKITLGTIGFRILHHFGNQMANNSGPIIYGYLQ